MVKKLLRRTHQWQIGRKKLHQVYQNSRMEKIVYLQEEGNWIYDTIDQAALKYQYPCITGKTKRHWESSKDDEVARMEFVREYSGSTLCQWSKVGQEVELSAENRGPTFADFRWKANGSTITYTVRESVFKEWSSGLTRIRKEMLWLPTSMFQKSSVATLQVHLNQRNRVNLNLKTKPARAKEAGRS